MKLFLKSIALIALLAVTAFGLTRLSGALRQFSAAAGVQPSPETATPPPRAIASPVDNNPQEAEATPTRAAATIGPVHSNSGQVRRDLTYCTLDGVELKMDVAFPHEMTQPAPVIVYVHGGGWTGGDKSRGEGLGLGQPMLDKGYLLVSINYRLAPAHQFPAPIEDVKCAIRFLRANAGEFYLDPDRIGVIGRSAGGHLVSLLGLSDASAGFDEAGGYTEQSSRVQAVVDLYGAIDIPAYFSKSGKDILNGLFGTTNLQDPLFERMSPLNYVSADDPPFLIVHGRDDRIVPPAHSQALYDALEAAGVPVEIIWVKNAGHGLSPEGGAIDPTQDEIAMQIMDFFDRVLAAPAP